MRERHVAPRPVHAHAQELRPVLLELREDLVVQRHLVPADRAPVRRVKRQDHRLAAEVAQRDALVRGAGEREVGGGGVGCEHVHGCSGLSVPLIEASRQSAPSSPRTQTP